jgi:hypothetical protein
MGNSVPERLASLEVTVNHMHEDLKEQREAGDEIHTKILEKVEAVLIAQAQDEGERRANRRMAGLVSLAVSTVISMIAIACNYFL